MPAYFASDVHLRLDYPDRGRRFARFVDSLEPADTLTIVGDLCDFWLAARQLDNAATSCPGLRALARFRARGGEITILPGNHDLWMGPFYEETLGARFLQEPVAVEAYGLRLLLVHGHRLSGRRFWKSWMEGPTFLGAFRRCPAPAAGVLDRVLERSNERHHAADDLRQLAAYRQFTTERAGEVEIVVLGHVHQIVDESIPPARMIVLGGWHRQSSYLKVDASGASLIVTCDPAPTPCESQSSGPP